MDILGKRNALCGMTRIGKLNTVKMLVEATEKLSNKSNKQRTTLTQSFEDDINPFQEQRFKNKDIKNQEPRTKTHDTRTKTHEQRTRNKHSRRKIQGVYIRRFKNPNH